MFGCFTAIITRREPPDVTAIAIETGIQNTGIAILLLKVFLDCVYKFLYRIELLFLDIILCSLYISYYN